MTDLELVAAAWEARQQACAPYFLVTLSARRLSSQTGNVFSGANVESSSYGLSICAERVALVKALSDGNHGPFVKIAVVADGPLLLCPAERAANCLPIMPRTSNSCFRASPASLNVYRWPHFSPAPFRPNS